LADEYVRIEVAFDGGQIMSARVVTESVDELERALAAGEDRAVALGADDGRYTVVLRRVVYLKRFSRETRVSFGAR